jgi:murein DD-endopeptidase MepM/ murein hydrolase activator NlpD
MLRVVLRIILVALGTAVLVWSFHVRSTATKRLWEAERDIARSNARIPQQVGRNQATNVVPLPVDRGTTFSELLVRANVDSPTVYQIVQAARPMLNFRRLKQGQRVLLVRSGSGQLESLRYRISPGEEIVIVRSGDRFEVTSTQIPNTTDIVSVQGKVRSSLFDAVLDRGEHPELAVRLAGIFAWDLDFYTDPQPGDTFRLVFEKTAYPGDQTTFYGRILAAEYINSGRPYRAVLYDDQAGQTGYYSPDGKSLQKAFLRSPLKFDARISSHFTARRFHPVLKRYRPHLGTDYAAPTGTPVQAVAAGRVLRSGRLGGDGIMVRLRHANGYETYYLHLSRVLVRTGQAVKQGQQIGRVGATGLATGPHLDFRVRMRGRFVNFEAMKLRSATPIPRERFAEFAVQRDHWLSMLDVASAANAASAQTWGAAMGHAGVE